MYFFLTPTLPGKFLKFCSKKYFVEDVKQKETTKRQIIMLNISNSNSDICFSKVNQLWKLNMLKVIGKTADFFSSVFL